MSLLLEKDSRAFFKKTVDFTASQTAQAIWTPTTGSRYVITDYIVSCSASGTITIFDNSDSTANRIAKVNLATNGGCVVNCSKVIPGAAVNNVLKYTTGAGMVGSLTVWGYELDA